MVHWFNGEVRRDSLPTIFYLDTYAANQLAPADSSVKKK